METAVWPPCRQVGEEGRHFGLPAAVHVGAFHPVQARLQVFGHEVADEQAVLAQE
jgi:hypothetical protein